MTENINFIKKGLFKKYYSSCFINKEIFPLNPKFHHFRVELFSTRGRRFIRQKNIYYKTDELKKLYKKIVPKNAYFSPVKWLNPIYMSKNKNEIDVMLSSPLYFDIDFKHLNPPTYENSITTTLDLCDHINNEYNKKPDKIIFSGKQGFHIHYLEWDENEILKLTPSERIKEFISSRKKIVDELFKNKIFIDQTVTPDPFRILKVSNTLHGETGLIASPVESLKQFNPIEKSRFFSLEIHENIFSLDFSIYEI